MTIEDVPIGDTVPFDEFPYQSERDRVRFPVQGPMYDPKNIPVYWDEYTRSLRVVPNMSFVTFERRADGWTRVE